MDAGAHSKNFTCTNKCSFTIWPATLSSGGTPQLPSTGFELPSKATYTIDVPTPWSGRFWARTHCSTDSESGRFSCATGDCGSAQISCNGAGGIPPATLVEFTLAPNSSSSGNGQDFYDVSLVDGFNLPVSVIPYVEATQVTPYGGSCNTSSCSNDVNKVCPQDFAIKGSDGSVIACKSACLALKKPEYCCSDSYGTPDKCPPNKYSVIFKSQCPQAYSYAYDDRTSTFTCSAGANYVLTFCP
ncbi:Thaumatin-like protein 1 [Stylosanthes scabra]|uniref:Thaumatin-like protein 1 n=1 Tax=Stylosanthes scabra TaxID=79078 RepID=A0ABU6YDN2_9FABA|nr:Thaumatin-like protein 1 [Stylosanthes scabra]